MKKQRVSITPLYAASGAFAPQWKPGTDLPAALMVLRRGDNPSTKGNFAVSGLTEAEWAGVMRKHGRDRVTIDFEHNTLEGSPAWKQSTEPRPVAGRGIPKVTPLGIEVTDIEWTTEGRKMAEHYGDLSPAPYHLEDGTVVGLHSVALVRNGAVYDLTFCSADAGLTIETETQEEDDMKELLAALTAAKLIPENGTETDVVKLIVDLRTKQETAEAALAKVVALTADQVKAIALDVAKAEVTALTAELAGLKAESVKAEKRHLLEMAKFEGKVVALTAEVVETLTVEQLAEQIKKIRPTVPLGQRTPDVILLSADSPGPHSEVDLAVAKACGVVLK